MDKGQRNEEYLKIGVQYYLSARAASFAYLTPVAGNLFHHAIEMFFKFLLLDELTARQLKDKFGHNLLKLWKYYKIQQNDKKLNRNNSLVKKLNDFEELRYPTGKGYMIFIDFRRGYHSHVKQPSPVKMPKEYRLNLEEIDEFITIILKKTVNPDWIKNLLFHGNAKGLYEKDNLHKIYDEADM